MLTVDKHYQAARDITHGLGFRLNQFTVSDGGTPQEIEIDIDIDNSGAELFLRRHLDSEMDIVEALRLVDQHGLTAKAVHKPGIAYEDLFFGQPCQNLPALHEEDADLQRDLNRYFQHDAQWLIQRIR